MTDRPTRIQLSRRNGFRLRDQSPDGRPVVNVARPSRWGNPFRVGIDGDAAECVAKFREEYFGYRHGDDLAKFLECESWMETAKLDLVGKHLACWCPLGSPCHADVLLAIAND